MNTLSLIHRDYSVKSFYNPETSHWEIIFHCDKFNDTDSHKRLTKIDMETFRDNAKRLYEAIEEALECNG